MQPTGLSSPEAQMPSTKLCLTEFSLNIAFYACQAEAGMMAPCSHDVKVPVSPIVLHAKSAHQPQVYRVSARSDAGVGHQCMTYKR